MGSLLSGKKPLAVMFGGVSVAGPKPENQDAFAALSPRDAELLLHKGVTLALADGLSTSSDSATASQMAVQEFIDEYYTTQTTWSVQESAAKVLRSLNSWFYARNNATSSNGNAALATTFAGAVIKGRQAYIMHAGDSRVYLYRKQKLTALTRDHSRAYNGTTVLTRAMGVDVHLDVDLRREELEEGDVLMLSSDGLHSRFLSDELEATLGGLLSAHRRPQSNELEFVANALVAAAIKSGADDNVSCLLGRVTSLPTETLDEAHQRLTELRIPPVLKRGMKIDGLEVQQVLHNSTRSHLYVVKRLDDGQQLVLKAPSRNFADDPVYLEGFMREQWLGEQINHSGVMKTYPRPSDSPFLYMLCEQVPGQSLRQWIVDNRTPPLEIVRRIAESLIQALRALQRAGVVHRDLKPENVMVDEALHCTVIDYGTAQVKGLDELASVVREDMALGSVNYIAPEYLLGKPASMLSDQFSLGCIIYELLTGKLPFNMDSSRLHQPDSVSDWHYSRARRHRSDLPQWVEQAIKKACDPEPQNRYSSYSEFLQDLQRPGSTAERAVRKQPLLKRYPMRFWQVSTWVLLSVVLIQAVLLLN